MELTKLKGHQRPITNLNLHNNILFSTSKDCNMAIWDVITNYKTISCSGSISLSGIIEDKQIYTGSADGMLSLWDFNGEKINNFLAKGPIRDISFNKQNKIFYVLAKKLVKLESVITILDSNLNKIRELELEDECNSILQLNNFVICGSCEGVLKIFDMELNLVNKLEIHKGEITNIKVDYSKKIIVTSSYDYSLKILDINTFEVLSSYKHKASILSFSIHPTKNIIAIGGGHDKMSIASSSNSGQFDVIMIDSINGNKLFDFDSKHFGPINSVTFHSDENIFITGGEDGYIHYWNCVDNWINLNINENLKIEYNIMNQLLIDSEILFKSLNGAEKRNQRRNLKKKIEKLKINLPIKLNEINS
tara:strand:+ start:103 stop:1191 length:1089 start_codon:yes stop_codon:yes gene_type:complete